MKHRRDRIREALATLEVDALLVTMPVNVRYLTGFSGSNGQLIVGDTDVFLTDPRYEEQAAREVPDCKREIYLGGGTVRGVADVVSSLGLGRLGFEAAHVTVAGARAFEEAIAPAVLVETTEVVEPLRRTKDDAEVEAMRRACAIGDEGFSRLLGELREGMSEIEAAAALEDAMRRAGSEGLSFETIVAFGESAAEPHHRATAERRLRSGDVVKIDFGATWGGYHSDMTRTVCFGAPPAEIAAIHEIVRLAQQAGVEAVSAGIEAGSVDAAARGPIVAAGYDFGHGTGHGIGLQVHEAPRVGKNAADILAAGTAITVEPGIYLPGVGGVRIEDTVIVREGGCEILTQSPRDLIEV